MAERSAGYRARTMEQGRRIRRAAEERYAAIFAGVDLMVLPTVPAPAPLLSEDASPWERPDEPFVEVPSRYTRLFNFIGYPAITVPCGLTSQGLPVGLQIAGRPFDESAVLRVARAYERATPWHAARPPAAEVRA
jgi:aspartyl-tRNA(Asn)/glutamyl-tRNA(Gln) amidotransferase subunit A